MSTSTNPDASEIRLLPTNAQVQYEPGQRLAAGLFTTDYCSMLGGFTRDQCLALGAAFTKIGRQMPKPKAEKKLSVVKHKIETS